MNRRAWLAGAVSIASTFLALYAVETLLTVVSPSWIDKLGTTLRPGPSIIGETFRVRRMGVAAYPFLQTDTFLDSTGHPTGLGQNLLPLSGIPGVMTILCHEENVTVGYRADSLGFRNPNEVWGSHDLAAFIVGDSFAQGYCRRQPETIPTLLLHKGFRVGTVGLTGAGPLSELGVLREYMRTAKPPVVYWMFYEGNDLIDLQTEAHSLLLRYLDQSFSQDLARKRADIATTEKLYADSLMLHYTGPSMRNRIIGFLSLRQLRTATGLYKGPEQEHRRDESKDVALFRRVMSVARSEVDAWGGQLVLVYLPERRRFNRRTRPVVGENHEPRDVQDSVLAIARSMDLPVLDAASAFAASENPASLWNARRYHYNARGYAIVARLIERDLRSRASQTRPAK